MSDILTDAELAEMQHPYFQGTLDLARILATIDADRKEIARLRGIEERAKAQVAFHGTHVDDFPHEIAHYTARAILGKVSEPDACHEEGT
jgi:hypothetical protein